MGVGQPADIPSLASVLQSGYHFYWVDATNGSATPAPKDIISHVTSDFAPWQKAAVKQLNSPDDVPPACQQNFNGFSECWAAIIFNDIVGFSGVNYTIRADAGLRYVNVEKHNSDVELRVLPLQWALDSAILSLQTGHSYPTPQEEPFTMETNTEQSKETRLGYLNGIRELFVLVL